MAAASRWSLIALTLCLVLAVCVERVPAAEQGGSVSGTVTVDGQPLKTGRILFWTGKDQFVGAKITDGKYAINRVFAEEYGITVEGSRVPAKYTDPARSGLRVTVRDEAAEINLDLTGR